MIKYSLICDQKHTFEGWFSSSDDFDSQREGGLLSCPACGSGAVEKSLMAPRISGAKKSRTEQLPVTSMPTPPIAPELMDQLRKFKKHVEANAENVGDRFAEEARKIHYGEAEARGIYGKTSIEEAVSLNEEGVNVLPIPDLPEEKN